MKTLYDDYRAFCVDEGIQNKFVLKQIRYKEQIIDDLKLPYKQHYVEQGRLTGFLLDYEKLQPAIGKATKIKDFIFEREEVEEQAN